MPSPSPAVTEGLRRARPLLGTLVDISAAGGLPLPALHAAVDAAFDAVARVHALMSRQDPDSELSRLNRQAPGDAQAVHMHTWTVLRAALDLAALSDGAFDPSLGNWRYIELEEGRVRFRRPLRLDLGGIAKGYAVDLAVSVLGDAGVEHTLVNAGGDLRTTGAPYAVGLRDPRDASAVAHVVELRNAALASSSACFSRRWVDGREVSELVDPHSGGFYTGLEGISVRAPDCMTADALTKVLLFAPPAVAERALAVCRAEAIRLMPSG